MLFLTIEVDFVDFEFEQFWTIHDHQFFGPNPVMDEKKMKDLNSVSELLKVVLKVLKVLVHSMVLNIKDLSFWSVLKAVQLLDLR